MKGCPHCNAELRKECFSKNKSEKDGLQRFCKKCMATYNLKWRISNPERRKGLSRKSNLKNWYGISIDEYDSMLTDQGGGCAICGTTTPRGTGRFCVDHDHATGKVRGLLCNNCNSGIGHLGDCVERLILAIKYLNASTEAKENRNVV